MGKPQHVHDVDSRVRVKGTEPGFRASSADPCLEIITDPSEIISAASCQPASLEKMALHHTLRRACLTRAPQSPGPQPPLPSLSSVSAPGLQIMYILFRLRLKGTGNNNSARGRAASGEHRGRRIKTDLIWSSTRRYGRVTACKPGIRGAGEGGA